MNKDPSPDLYQILDRVGLSAGNLLANRTPMAKLITIMRGRLVNELKDYIEARETGREIHIDIETEDQEDGTRI